jgi:hypothetical protein
LEDDGLEMTLEDEEVAVVLKDSDDDVDGVFEALEVTFDKLVELVNLELLKLLVVFTVDDENVEILMLELLVLARVDEVEVFNVYVWIVDVLKLEAVRLEVEETALPPS